MLNLANAVERSLWLLPAFPLVGLFLWALVDEDWESRIGARIALASSVLSVIGWWIAFSALATLYKGDRTFLLEIPLWDRGVHSYALTWRLDTLSATMGVVVAMLALLLQCFVLGHGQPLSAMAGIAASLAATSLVLLMGDYVGLSVAWVGLALASYLWPRSSETASLRSASPANVPLADIVSVALLALGAINLVRTCPSPEFGVVQACWLGALPEAPWRTPIALVLLGAVIATLAKAVLAALIGEVDGTPHLQMAAIFGLTAIPGSLYLLLRSRELILAVPAATVVCHYVGLVGALVCALLLVFQRRLVRALTFIGVADGCLALAALGHDASYLAYWAVVQPILAMGLFIAIGLRQHLGPESDGNWDLSELHREDALIVAGAFGLVIFAQTAVPLLSGYPGKGVLLVTSLASGRPAFLASGLVVIACVSFYAWRLVLAALSMPTATVDLGEELPALPALMWLPAIVLVILSLVVGLMAPALRAWLSLSLPAEEATRAGASLWVALAPVYGVVAGLLWAWRDHAQSARWRFPSRPSSPAPTAGARLVPSRGASTPASSAISRGTASQEAQQDLASLAKGALASTRSLVAAAPRDTVAIISLLSLLLFLLWIR